MSLTRRRFMQTLALSAAALSLPSLANARPSGPSGPLPADRLRFPQSVASGDPRPDRILLWSRIASPRAQETVLLQVAANAEFSGALVERELHSRQRHDHCLRIRLTDLAPAQTLHYRFLLRDGGSWISSPAGRTRTAPAVDADVPVRFAFMSCQDYGGRWYNSLLPLLDEDLDFVLHLGDFIYETVGDPSFQSQGGHTESRRIAFDDLPGALRLGSDDAPYFAARSLDNYRQLHRTVRTDPVLQRLLERAPLVAIWDDHEFADDCWQANATHHDGRVDEADIEHRRNAEQAYLEYMPIDPEPMPDDAGHLSRDDLFPQLRIWRRLRFGRQVELFLTDTRSERPDHLVPEDAFPGTVLYDAAELHQRLPALGIDPASLQPLLVPWFDLDLPEHAALREPLLNVVAAACLREGLAQQVAGQYAATACRGRIAWPVLDTLLRQWNEQAPAAAQVRIPAATAAGGLGLAWISLGKTQLFGSLGARYMVPAEAYDALAALRGDALRRPVSEPQWQWLAEGLQGSDARWKVLASSISLTPIVLDLSRPELAAPAAMRHRFLLNVDHWDGFPGARRTLVDELCAQAGNVIAVSGDIHAAFVSQHAPRVAEFTVPAVSSATLGDILMAQGRADPATAEATTALAAMLDPLIAAGSPRIRHVETRVHGTCLARATSAAFDVELQTLPPQVCLQPSYDDPAAVSAQLQRRRFHVSAEDGQVVAV